LSEQPLRRVLVSACLLGERVRFDGALLPGPGALLSRWLSEGRVVAICPEVTGGLPVPRPPVELQPDGRVLNEQGQDVTAALQAGAAEAVRLGLANGVVCAVLKESSPSCGTSRVHDGSFRGREVPGEGLAAKALRRAGIAVFSEAQLGEADAVVRGAG
jgi:uncharacterized protein YbbK (DUF523 family)